MSDEHVHRFECYHADYCHKYEDGEMCACGEKRHVEMRLRDFLTLDSAWWNWGRAGCVHCEALMRSAGLDPAALHDEELACRLICEADLKEGSGNQYGWTAEGLWVIESIHGSSVDHAE